METVEFSLPVGEAYAMASVVQWDTIRDDGRYRVRLGPMRDQILSAVWQTEAMVLSALGTPYPDIGSRMATRGVGSVSRSEIRRGPIRPWLVDLHLAQLRACRATASFGGLDLVRRGDIPVSDVTDQLVTRVAAVSPAIITAGVVGVVAAVSLAIAWWQRGKADAEASTAGAQIKQASAANAATQIARQYIERGKDPPPEVIRAFAALAGGEPARSWGAPLAAAAVAGAAVGAGGYYAWTHRGT